MSSLVGQASPENSTGSSDAGEIDTAHHPSLPGLLTAEMSRLFRNGYSLIPLGGRDGKTPIVAYRDRKRLPLSLVIERMAAGGSLSFGIRLKGLLVVDVDSDTAAAREYVRRRFGQSPAEVRTGRGYHLYFRHHGPKPQAVRSPGIIIDFKAGENEIAVGPKSQRPDGVTYTSDGQLIALAALPWFRDSAQSAPDDGPLQVRRNGKHPLGTRHKALKRRAHQLAFTSETFEELMVDLLAARDWEIERPEDFPDSRVESIGRWYWTKHEAGQLWGGKKSCVQIERATFDELARRGEFLALTLLGLLTAAHSHKPDSLFAIVPEALRASGRVKAGRNQIYGAIRLLLELGLIHCRRQGRGKKDPHLYQLGNGRIEGGKGGRSLLTLVPGKGTHSGKCSGPRIGEVAA